MPKADVAAPSQCNIVIRSRPSAADAIATTTGVAPMMSALFETDVPHTEASPHFFSGDRKWDHLASSKMIVNLHRSALGYCEWQRVVGAMTNGCVVVTEHSLGMAPLVPGEHFINESCDALAEG